MFPFFGRPSLMGLDIGSSAVKLIELEAHGGKYRLKRFGYAGVPNGKEGAKMGIREEILCESHYSRGINMLKVFLPEAMPWQTVGLVFISRTG